jgi:hypothetical protein
VYEVKQLTALFLMGLFLFNLAGYRLFFHYVQQKADTQYEYALDRNDYDESKMITVKVDLEMPYLAENTNFERVDGEISVDGKIYKYVKRKIHNGQLVLLCLADEKKTKLKSARDEYFSIANNLVTHSNTKESAPKSSSEKNITTDYDQFLVSYTIGYSPEATHFSRATDESAALPAHRNLPAQPPELA